MVVVCGSLTQVMRKFARQLDDWLKTALEDVPLSLQQTKTDCEYCSPALIQRHLIHDFNYCRACRLLQAVVACNPRQLNFKTYLIIP